MMFMRSSSLPGSPQRPFSTRALQKQPPFRLCLCAGRTKGRLARVLCVGGKLDQDPDGIAFLLLDVDRTRCAGASKAELQLRLLHAKAIEHDLPKPRRQRRIVDAKLASRCIGEDPKGSPQ